MAFLGSILIRRLVRAVLSRISGIVLSLPPFPYSGDQSLHLTLHTTRPQRRHGETMSRAHRRTLAAQRRVSSIMYSQLDVRALNRCASSWLMLVRSWVQRSVLVSRVLRYWSRPERMPRHVRARESRSVLSIWVMTAKTML